MENENKIINNNDEVKVKEPKIKKEPKVKKEKKVKEEKPKKEKKPPMTVEERREKQRIHYLTVLKHDPDYQRRQRESSMKHYYKHQEQVKERVANYAQKKREMTMIERLCEIQQEKANEEEEITEFMVNELARMELKLL